MKRRSKKKSLTRELLWLCILAFVISFVFYQVVMNLGVEYISGRYNTEEHIIRLEKRYAKALQDYVKKHQIALDDLESIDAWTMAQDDVYLKLFCEGNLIYDTLYGVADYEGIPQERVEEYSQMNVYPILLEGEEVEAILFGYDYRIENYARYVTILLAFLLFLIVLIIGIRKKIRYLEEISGEVELLSEDLQQEVTVRGEDEIATVAKGIEQLRKSVLEKMENEKRAYDANMNLVTSLSHDLKTPLTSVIGYLELAKEKAKNDEELGKCVDISLEKAMYLKKQTNDLFEHFLLHSNGYQIAFEEVNANELIVQMLEENLLELEVKGVVVQRKISDITSGLRVNVHLIHRVFDNLFSNLNKYADLKKAVEVEYYLEGNDLMISIENAKSAGQRDHQDSTKIGLDNCRAIMEKHQGRLKIEETKERFRVILCLPVVR